MCAAHETDALQPRRNMRGRPREGKSEETPSRSSLNRSQSIRSRAMSAAWIIAARVADSTGVDHPATLDLFHEPRKSMPLLSRKLMYFLKMPGNFRLHSNLADVYERNMNM